MIGGSIRRPVAVAMGCLAVALMGASAWRNIPIGLLPDTRLPRLNVRAEWPGASPETVEAFLTSPIEAAVQQVKGVEKVISLSREVQGTGTSGIEVQFSRDTDMDFARLDLSERLSALEEELPPAVRRILVEPYVPPEFESRSQRGFLRYTYTGPYTLEALRADLDDRVVPDLTQIEGVALVQASGGRERLIEIELNEDRVSSLGLSPGVVNRRINDLDLVREAGAVRTGDQEWSVTIQNRVARADEIRGTVLLENRGALGARLRCGGCPRQLRGTPKLLPHRRPACGLVRGDSRDRRQHGERGGCGEGAGGAAGTCGAGGDEHDPQLRREREHQGAD